MIVGAENRFGQFSDLTTTRGARFADFKRSETVQNSNIISRPSIGFHFAYMKHA